MKKNLTFGLVLFGMLLLWQPAAAQITIDGLFFDWEAATQVDVAPQAEELTFEAGDVDCPNPAVPSYFADLDIEDLYVTDDADFVYFRVRMNQIANITNVPNDTSYHGGAAIAVYISVDPGWADATGLTWGWWGSGYDYFIQVYPEDSTVINATAYDQYVWEHKQAGNGWDFVPADSSIGSKVAWNATSNEVEFSVPKTLLFNPHYLPDFVRPDTIAVMVYAGENLAPWRADYASNAGIAGFKFALQQPGPITIDGLFFDWTAEMQLDVPAQAQELTFAEGDPETPNPANTSYFADLDIEDLYATDDEDFVYVRVKMNSIANLMNVPNDTSYHGGAAIAAYISVDPGAADTTGLTWGWWGSGYDFFVQAYPADSAYAAVGGYPQALWEHKQAGNGWDFEVVDSTRGAWIAWNAMSNDVEMAIPKVQLLNPRYLANFQQPDKIAIMIYAGENLAPWRADYASMPGIAGFILDLGGSTGVEATPVKALPDRLTLHQNYPNPFNPSTDIRFALPVQGLVRIRVFDLLGKEMAVLANRVYPAGEHSVTFDGRDLPSGVYLYSLETEQSRSVRKMMLIK
ncbi:MAG TPA: T9SS type A sorting domain-containing protein [bacterium]|nr:T9SS type A sorting domain-containing protein [bacterium]